MLAKRVLEVVRVLPVRDRDRHRAREARQLAGAGVGYYGDGELRRAAVHGAAVLEDEAAGAAVQRPADPLDGDVAGRAFDGRAGGQHLAPAGPVQVAVERL